MCRYFNRFKFVIIAVRRIVIERDKINSIKVFVVKLFHGKHDYWKIEIIIISHNWKYWWCCDWWGMGIKECATLWIACNSATRVIPDYRMSSNIGQYSWVTDRDDFCTSTKLRQLGVYIRYVKNCRYSR